MTSTVPDTGVIEGIDEQGVPTCTVTEGKCSEPATVRLRYACGCPDLACSGHYAGYLRHLADRLALAGSAYCTICGWSGLARRVSDVIVAVIPL